MKKLQNNNPLNENTFFHQLPLWQTAFRPFFLVGLFFGIFSLSLWIISFTSLNTQIPFALSPLWHSHEMVFGFTMAIIFGFLYTASQNWAGKKGLNGVKLIFITLVWLTGRVAFSIPNLNPLLLAIIDLAFIPIATLFFASFLLKHKLFKNLIFIGILISIWTANLIYHLNILEIFKSNPTDAITFAIHIITALILVLSGRIIPFFSSKVLKNYTKEVHPNIDKAIIILSLLFSFIVFSTNGSSFSDSLAGIIAVLCFFRIYLWFDSGIFRVPILLILYLGNLWIAIGFFIFSVSSYSSLPQSVSTHVFTIGGISTMIFGMVSRVSLGHTGRPIKANNFVLLTFILVSLSVIIRLLGQLRFSEYYILTITISGVLWVLSALFLAVYFTPILLRKRIDGKSG